MAKVRLKNLQRRRVCFNLEAPYFVDQQGVNGAGKPEVLMLAPRGVALVSDKVLECYEIKSALNPRRGRPTLRVIG